MIELSRGYVAYLLAGYGEPEASAAILKSSNEEFARVREAANQAALKQEEWLKVACQVAVEVIEGQPRALRRRVFSPSDMPQDLLAEDSKKHAERTQRFMSGAPVKKREIIIALSSELGPALAGYKYFKSRAQFERSFPGGTRFVTLHRGRGIAYINFGVTIDEVENAERALFGPRMSVGESWPHPLTVVASSLNISPRSHFWPHPSEASWLILGQDGLAMAAVEAVAFVESVVVPFLEGNCSPVSIRDTLLTHRGKVAAMRPAQTVFAIDWLERRRNWLDADFALFEERFQDFSLKNRDELKREYETTVARWKIPAIVDETPNSNR